MLTINPGNITIDKISLPALQKRNIQAEVLRLDKIHPVVSGNKWFKLRFYLDEALQQQKKTVITFGGAWSNHIVATAAACKLYNLSSISIIRGEEPLNYSATLQQAKEMGMQFHFISREQYRDKIIPSFISSEETFIINEGGYGEEGARGAATILDYCKKENYTHICCAAGTGTMAAGLINTISIEQKVIAISALKNNTGLANSIQSLLNNSSPDFSIIHDYHFGGYAKHTPALLKFMNDFYLQTGIPTDFVYTAKLFFAINDLVEEDYFPLGSRLLIIHSGGLQGNTSLNNGTLIF
jgi:1-aminocyclopropane-1-carboxylate deaminase